MSTTIMQFFWAMCNTFLESKSYTLKNAQVVTSLQTSCSKYVVKVSTGCDPLVYHKSVVTILLEAVSIICNKSCNNKFLALRSYQNYIFA